MGISSANAEEETNKLQIGGEAELFWALDEKWRAGTVFTYDDQENKHVISYGDGDTEELNNLCEQCKMEFSNITIGNNIELPPVKGI